jgi:hypothetical protein
MALNDSSVAPQPDLSDAYMAHDNAMRGQAAVEQLDAMMGNQKPPGTPVPPAAPLPQKTLGEQASGVVSAVAGDIGTTLKEQPRIVYKAVRDAYQSVIDLAKDAGDFTNKYLPAIQVTGAGAPRIVTPAERAADPTLPGALADDIHFPDIDAPTSKIGTVEKNIIQFAVGMRSAGKQLEALGLPAATTAWGARSLTAVKGFLGMFEAFDGPKQNLSNLVQSVPALENPVTEMLAAKGDDSDIVKRLKSAAEGTVIGQGIDGLVSGLRMLRSANVAKDAAEEAAGLASGNADLAEDIGPPKSGGLAAMGETSGTGSAVTSINLDQSASRMAKAGETTVDMTPEQVAAMGKPAAAEELAGPSSPGATEAQAKEPGVYLNFNKINSQDDITRTMSELADAFKGNIDVARRGVQTWEDAKLGADAVNAWETLMSRRTGEVLNNEETLAVRSLWVSATAKLREVSEIAVSDPTPENLFAFRRMQAAHQAIQEQVLGARAEAARSLGSWNIPVGAEDYRMGQMLTAMKSDTGPLSDGLAVSLNMAQRTKALMESMDYDGVNNFAEKSFYAKTRDAVLEAWTNALLTAVGTHVKVTASNAATVALRIAERSTAENLAKLGGATNGVSVGEAAAQYAGLIGGLKDAFRYAGKAANAFLSEEPLPPLGNDPLSNAIKAAKTGTYSAGTDNPEYRFGGAISSQAFNISSSGWLGRSVDLLGQVVRSPGRALTAEHDFFRSIGYRMELHALATRQATAEVSAGQISADALPDRIAEIIANPPPSVTIGSIDAMKYQTFTDAPGTFAQHLEQLRTSYPLIRLVLPFYKIPSRIMAFTVERSPFAPVMASYRANIAAGGAREGLARAQVGLGTGVMLATIDSVLSGTLTGSGPPERSQRGAMMDTGWLPYSMKVGDRWVQYNRLETVGSSMAMAADVVETMKAYNTAMNADDPDMGNLAAATVLAVAQDVTSKTYLQGVANIFEMMANPKTEGMAKARSFAGSIVPAGVASIDRITDPYQRSVYSILDAIKARTPGLSESLPPVRSVWGEPLQHDSGMGKAYDLLSPFPTRAPTDSPIDKEIVRLGANVNLPAAKVSFGQGATVDLRKDPAIYSRYVELAGNAYKDPAWRLGAKDMLNQLVSGTSPLSAIYNMKSDGPEGMKAEMIKGIMNQYREGAKQQLLTEYPQLQGTVDKKRESVQALKMPVID